MMNSNVMSPLDFVEEIDGFKEKCKADQACQHKEYRKHSNICKELSKSNA